MRRAPQSGFALVAAMLISFILLSTVIMYTQFSRTSTSGGIHRMATQKALSNADGGVQAALAWLRQPQAAQLDRGETMTLQSLTPGTTYALTLSRQVTDGSLVDVWSTGYYHISTGSDELNGERVQLAAVYAQIQVRNVGDYFAASPGSLEIAYGSDISSGSIYARNLIFGTGSGSPTVIKSAYYFGSFVPSNASSFVTFLDAPNTPVQLTSEPSLPTLDATMASKYQHMAGTDILPAGTVLAGLINPPANDYKVYYAPGDITLGDSISSFTVAGGSFLIFCAGKITIANSVLATGVGANWPGFMAQGNIEIAATAPDSLTIMGTMVTNGAFKALGSPRPNGVVAFEGGIVSSNGVQLGNVYALRRQYSYQSPDPTLPLPFVTQLRAYKVLRGKYNQ